MSQFWTASSSLELLPTIMPTIMPSIALLAIAGLVWVQARRVDTLNRAIAMLQTLSELKDQAFEAEQRRHVAELEQQRRNLTQLSLAHGISEESLDTTRFALRESEFIANAWRTQALTESRIVGGFLAYQGEVERAANDPHDATRDANDHPGSRARPGQPGDDLPRSPQTPVGKTARTPATAGISQPDSADG